MMSQQVKSQRPPRGSKTKGNFACRTCRIRHQGCNKEHPVCSTCRNDGKECVWREEDSHIETPGQSLRTNATMPLKNAGLDNAGNILGLASGFEQQALASGFQQQALALRLPYHAAPGLIDPQLFNADSQSPVDTSMLPDTPDSGDMSTLPFIYDLPNTQGSFGNTLNKRNADENEMGGAILDVANVGPEQAHADMIDQLKAWLDQQDQMAGHEGMMQQDTMMHGASSTLKRQAYGPGDSDPSAKRQRQHEYLDPNQDLDLSDFSEAYLQASANQDIDQESLQATAANSLVQYNHQVAAANAGAQCNAYIAAGFGMDATNSQGNGNHPTGQHDPQATNDSQVGRHDPYSFASQVLNQSQPAPVPTSQAVPITNTQTSTGVQIYRPPPPHPIYRVQNPSHWVAGVGDGRTFMLRQIVPHKYRGNQFMTNDGEPKFEEGRERMRRRFAAGDPQIYSLEESS